MISDCASKRHHQNIAEGIDRKSLINENASFLFKCKIMAMLSLIKAVVPVFAAYSAMEWGLYN
jgi:hypothetical protein